MWLAIFVPEIYAKQTVGTFYYNQKNSHNMSYKIKKKLVKNKNSAYSCHGIEVAVLTVQGPYQI